MGLNLTAADHCYLMDLWCVVNAPGRTRTSLGLFLRPPLGFGPARWNPAVEEQAIDRVHRIGQTRNVVVTRYVRVCGEQCWLETTLTALSCAPDTKYFPPLA